MIFQHVLRFSILFEIYVPNFKVQLHHNDISSAALDRVIVSGVFSLGKMLKESAMFFRVAMAGLGKYCTIGCGPNAV